MRLHSLPVRLVIRGIIAQYVGLVVASFYVMWRIGGASALQGFVEGVILGAVFAAPWSITMLLLFILTSKWLERHVALLCLIGPLLVCATFYVLAVTTDLFTAGWMDAVALASLVASVVYFILHFRAQRLEAGDV
ncbi:hypothetical protein GCM10010990_25630 [Croceicoccus mobilis]|uniref:Uncharacterized protein n=1 Tax=Croceicoccus mobilis TaxID=1703339 RepID=A0A916Z3Q5_9SPHN|nr:hypothetical protein GCM10010990_25630 [Croceicoccus mobilis]